MHHVPLAFAHGTKLGTKLEEAFLNTNHAKMYLAINFVAIESCVVGKSNLYRRSDLDRVNGSLKPTISSAADDASRHGECGLAAFGRFLAEDNMIASALWHELGLRHELSCDVARNVVGNMTLSDYVWRRVRWIRVRKHMAFAATLVEPLTEGVALSVVDFTSLRYTTGVSLWLFYTLHLALWLLIDLDVCISLAGHLGPEAMRFIGAWAMREILALPIWVIAIFGDGVEWRGKNYTVMRQGEARRAGERTVRYWWWPRRRQRDEYERLEGAPS